MANSERATVALSVGIKFIGCAITVHSEEAGSLFKI